ADLRMREHASLRGYELNSIARKFVLEDFENFDWVITMDENNYSQISLLDKNKKFTHKIRRMTDFCERKKISSVPDPYYGGNQGFENVIDILEDSCMGFLNYLKSNR
ncbi:MAG: low molecular weight phosphotyrosine protein phosphatase, partial [SAR324 cluster bacterium]|nr:low molecular weight phosphotyrosine protein phosphatase [SAR324 cluster bacterium]